MENVLGRSAFHRVFDYMRDLAAVSDPWVADTAVLEYFTRKVDDPMAVKQASRACVRSRRLVLWGHGGGRCKAPLHTPPLAPTDSAVCGSVLQGTCARQQ